MRGDIELETMTATLPFHVLLDSHRPRVQRAAMGFLGHREDAREAAQEALLKAWRARESYDTARPFYPWLYRIVKNHCLDQIAKRRVRRPVALEVDRFASSAPDAELQAARSQSRARLWEGMQRLDAPHQEILNLRHFQDLSYAEMAEVLDVKEGTVMSRLYRARKALAAELGGAL